MHTSFRSYVLALVGCFLLASLITWPVVVNPSGGLVGHPGNDTWNHAWGLWWVVDGIWNRGGIPTHTGLLNYPDGGSLFFIDTFNAVLTAPAQKWFGLPFAYNAAVFFGVFWTAFGAWCLAYHVCRDRVGASVAAVAYGCNAHLLGQTYNGITETINAGWIPFFLLALLRLLDRPSPRRGLLMGLCFGLCALSNFYYGLFCLLIGVTVVLHAGFRDVRSVRWKAFFGSAVLGGLVALLLVLPVLAVLSGTMSQADAMVSRDPEFVWDSLLNHNYTDVVGFFRPGKVYSPDLKVEYGEELIIVTYLGWVLLALVALCLTLHRRRSELSLWIVLMAVFLVLRSVPTCTSAAETLSLWGGARFPCPSCRSLKPFPCSHASPTRFALWCRRFWPCRC